MRKWLRTFGPNAREMAWLLAIGVALLIGMLGFLLYLHLTGGPVRTAVMAFTTAFVVSYVLGRLGRRRV